MRFGALISFAFCLLSLGCSNPISKKPSVLIVASSRLPVNKIACNDRLISDQENGFGILCQESVRFTHAFTTSTMEVPSLGSILTGKYPFEIDLWSNGEGGLPARNVNFSEVLVERGYRTAFFSGGAPVWRRSGLHQGFELFDDHVDMNSGSLFRPLEKNVSLFSQWLEKQVQSDPFFSVIYAPDLQFESVETQTNLGDIRNKSYESQLAELGESLGQLIAQLKKKKRWNNTFFILVGLNGISSPNRDTEVKGTNLFGENTQVSLFVKPLTKKRDLGLQWKVDRSISLVDLGETIKRLLEIELPESSPPFLKKVSLLKTLVTGQPDWDKDRFLLIESGWPLWHGYGESRFAIRKDHLLFLNDKKLRVYNSLIDSQESFPVNNFSSSYKEVVKEVNQVFSRNGLLPWSGITKYQLEKTFVSSQVWKDEAYTIDDVRDLNALARKMPDDLQVKNWQARVALSRSDWKELRQVGVETNNIDWQYVAAANLGKAEDIPKSWCFQLLLSKKVNPKLEKKCSDPSISRLHRWINAGRSQRAKERGRFIRVIRDEFIDQKINKKNYQKELFWKFSYNEFRGPSLAQLALSIPKNKPYKKVIEKKFPGFFQ